MEKDKVSNWNNAEKIAFHIGVGNAKYMGKGELMDMYREDMDIIDHLEEIEANFVVEIWKDVWKEF